tara:strand:- start:584 stop:1021 length:438 start_codon:yes stop_codon:yes gene_type:complete
MKKTIEVYEILKWANERLATSNFRSSEIDGKEFRQGICATIETVLHMTGNYNGYMHLTESQVPEGCSPGIGNGVSLYDRSRRSYSYSNLMHEVEHSKKPKDFHEGHEPQMGNEHFVEEESDRHREATYDAWANESQNISESNVYE